MRRTPAKTDMVAATELLQGSRVIAFQEMFEPCHHVAAGPDEVPSSVNLDNREDLAFFVSELDPSSHAVLEAVDGIVLQILNIGPTAVLRTAGKAVELSLEASPDGVIFAANHL